MNLVFYIERLFLHIYEKFNSLFDAEDDIMATDHKILLPPGNYNVKLSSISVTKYTSGIPGDVTLTFELENVPNHLLSTEIAYKIEGNIDDEGDNEDGDIEDGD